MFDIFLKPLLVALTLALLGVGASHLVTTHKLNTTRAELAQVKGLRDAERAERMAVAMADAKKVADMQVAHAAEQQRLLNEFSKKSRPDNSARTGRVRDTIAAFAASGGGETESDAAACQSDRDKLAVVSGLLIEGAELVIESRSLTEQQADEIVLLQGIIKNDRKLLGE